MMMTLRREIDREGTL